MNDLRTKARAVRGQSFALRNSSLVANSACWRPEASRRPWCRSAPRAGRDGGWKINQGGDWPGD